MREFTRSCIVVGLSLPLVVCSSGEQEAREPDEPSPEVSDQSAPEPAPQKAPTATEAPATSQISDTLTPPRPPEYMVQQILGQKVLDHPQVTPYLHTEVAANLPLKVHAVSGLDQGASRLTAGGQQVQVMPTANTARFRFTSRERLAGAQVRIHFEIPDEGVIGHVNLELRDYVWEYIGVSVVER